MKDNLQQFLDSEDYDEAEYDKAMQDMFDDAYYKVRNRRVTS